MIGWDEIKKGCAYEVSHFQEYKKAAMHIGSSDIAQLTMTGPVGECGVLPTLVKFGGDGSYSAWLVRDESVIPEHYQKVAEFHTWLKIYDDTELVVDIKAGWNHPIKVYRAGEAGCLICIPPANETTVDDPKRKRLSLACEIEVNEALSNAFRAQLEHECAGMYDHWDRAYMESLIEDVEKNTPANWSEATRQELSRFLMCRAGFGLAEGNLQRAWTNEL